jgi:hypothetical protein
MLSSGFPLLTILAAAVASWLVGAVWYMAFGKAWMTALGKTRADLTGPSGKTSLVPFFVSFLAELLMAFVLAWLIARSFPGGLSFENGIIMGFVVWLGFVLTTITVNYQFARAKSLLTLIDSGHWLAVLLVQGAILGALR